MIDGGAGTDTLHIKDTVGAMNTTRAAATVSNVENMIVETAGRLGEVAANGVKQVNTYTMPTSVANVSQVTQLVILGNGGSDATLTFTYGTIGGSFSYDASEAHTTAASFVAAFNAATGTTSAIKGSAPTAATAVSASHGSATVSSVQVGSDIASTLKIGQSISGTGIASGAQITGFSVAASVTTITLSAANTATVSGTLTIGGGGDAVQIIAPVAGVPLNGVSISDATTYTPSTIKANTDGNVGETVSFTYNGLTGSYVIGADATATGNNFVSALNTVAGYTAGVNTTGSVAVTAQTAGTALPAITFSGATGNIPTGTVTTANGTAATEAKTYDVSGVSLENFTATATDVISLKAKATTELTLTGTGAITVNGGGGDSTFTSAGGAVSVGGTTTVANGFTSVTVAGTSTTVGITDNSGKAVDGVTVAVGSTLTSASITGNTQLATVTGKGVTSVSMAKSAGGLTVTNANAHALSLGLSGVTAGTVTDDTATSIAINTSASTLAATGNTLTGLTAAKAASVEVSGSKSLNMGTISATKLATVVISGTGGVTADVSAAGATTTAGFVTSVDTTGSTAVLSAANGTTANNITIGVSTDFAGGAGTDSVTVGASTKALTLGGGDDTLTLSAMLSGTATTGGTADGGDGTDTIALTLADAVTAGSSSGVLAAKIANFEKMSIVASTLTADNTVDFGYITELSNYVKVGAMGDSTNTYDLNLNNLATGATVEIAGDNTLVGYIAAAIANASFSTTDTLTIKLTSDDAVRAGGTVVAVGAETINVVNNNLATDGTANSTLNTLTLSGSTGVKTINVSGNAGLELTNTETTVATVDASGITGTTTQPNAFTWTAGILTNTAKTATVVGTAAGANTINLDAITDTLMTATITVGGEANVSANIFTGGAGVEIVTGGSGADTFTMKEGKDVITTGAGADKITFGTAAADRDTVTDFTAGSGGAADIIITSNYLASADYFAVTTRAASYEIDTADTGSVFEFAFEANSTVNLGDNSADSLNGTNLLKALNDGETAATLAVASGDDDSDLSYIVAYQGGKAFIYAHADSTTEVAIQASTLTLVGILENVAVGALTSANFSAS